MVEGGYFWLVILRFRLKCAKAPLGIVISYKVFIHTLILSPTPRKWCGKILTEFPWDPLSFATIGFSKGIMNEEGSIQLSKKWFVFFLCLSFCPFSVFPSLSLPPSLLTIIKWRLITLRLPANRNLALKWLLTGDRTQLAAGGVDTLLCMEGYKSIFWSWARVYKPARFSFSCSLNIDIDQTSINRDIRDGNWLSKWG